MKKLISILLVMAALASMTASGSAAGDEYHAACMQVLSAWQSVMTKSLGELDKMVGNGPDSLSYQVPDPFPEIPYASARYALLYRSELYYAQYDFDGNGRDELVIANGNGDTRHILGVYTFDGEKMNYFFRESPLKERVNLLGFHPELKFFTVVDSHGADDNTSFIYHFSYDGFTPVVEKVDNVVDGSANYQWFADNLTYVAFSESDGASPPAMPESPLDCRYTDVVFGYGGTYFALADNGTVTPFDADQGMSSEIETWTEITKIIGNESILFGLRKDGRVVYAAADYFRGETETLYASCRNWDSILDLTFSQHLIGLTASGTLAVAGTEWFGSHPTYDFTDWNNIKAVYCFTGFEECVIAVCNDGKVYTQNVTEGSEAFPGDIQMLSCASYIWAGIREDGMAFVGGPDSGTLVDEVAAWKNLKKVYAASASVIGVRTDGTIVTAGYGMPDLSAWTHISDAVLGRDKSVFGIQEDGSVICSLSERSTLDAARIEGWKEIEKLFVGEGDFLIGIKTDGSLITEGLNGD